MAMIRNKCVTVNILRMSEGCIQYVSVKTPYYELVLKTDSSTSNSNTHLYCVSVFSLVCFSFPFLTFSSP